MVEKSQKATRKRILQTAGAMSAVVGLAGCLGDDEEGSEDDSGDDSLGSETDEEQPDTEPDVGAELLEPFGEPSFDEGTILIELEDDFDLDEITLTDPFGRVIDIASPGGVERSISFSLYEVGVSDREFYTFGTYQILGFIEEDRLRNPDEDDEVPDIDPDDSIVVDGFVLVALASHDFRPELRLRTIEPGTEAGTAQLVIANEGTGPLPIQHRSVEITNFGTNPIYDPRTWVVPEENAEVLPGEEVSVPVEVGSVDSISGEEEEREEARETNCQGETEQYQMDLFINRMQIIRDVGTIVHRGEAVFEEGVGLSADEYVLCTEIEEET